MSDELYDVVDKNGNKIDTATWTECHKEGLLHQCVHGLVFRDEIKKEILVQKRNLNEAQCPGLLETSVAGHILSNETPDKGLLREMEEELFWENPLPKKIKIKRISSFFNHDMPNNFEIVYLYEIIYDGTFKNKDSVTKPVWVSWNKLLEDVSIRPEKYAKFFLNDISEYLKFQNMFTD